MHICYQVMIPKDNLLKGILAYVVHVQKACRKRGYMVCIKQIKAYCLDLIYCITI